MRDLENFAVLAVIVGVAALVYFNWDSIKGALDFSHATAEVKTWWDGTQLPSGMGVVSFADVGPSARSIAPGSALNGFDGKGDVVKLNAVEGGGFGGGGTDGF